MTEPATAPTDNTFETCPVCRAGSPVPFRRVRGRDYWRCRHCAATLLDPAGRLPRQDEYAHYLTHEIDSADPRYRAFLARLADPLLAKLTPGSTGLDYGCGPGPALAEMLREAGHRVALYDPFFHPDDGPLRYCYDFIVCTETAEHFFRPAQEFDRLDCLLRPGGWLGLMTCFQTEDSLFENWHYAKDPTHVTFYREETLCVIAVQRDWACEIVDRNVALFQKRSAKWRKTSKFVVFSAQLSTASLCKKNKKSRFFGQRHKLVLSSDSMCASQSFSWSR